jgi:hypothetical protein
LTRCSYLQYAIDSRVARDWLTIVEHSEFFT